MRKRLTTFTAIILMCGVTHASAQQINDATPCSAINEAMGSEAPERMRPVVEYLLNTLTALDEPYLSRGEPGIVGRMSDEGRTHVAATASVHCKRNPIQSVRDAVEFVYMGIRGMDKTFGLIPPPRPDYSETAGAWTITGRLVGNGSTVGCKMERDARDDTFGYMATLGVGGDNAVATALVLVPTAMAEGAKPVLTLTFDRMPPITMQGFVNSGYATTDLADAPIEEMVRRISLLQNSKKLTVAVSASGETAFDKNGMCMKEMVNAGIMRMKGTAQK
jgi:hypothetical protein